MGNSGRRLSGSRLSSPLEVRARLNSLGHRSPIRSKKASSSSTLTLKSPVKKNIPHLRPTTPSSSEATDSEDEEAAKEEEADRKVEEQEALDKKLKSLQMLITGETLGLIRSSPQGKGRGKEVDRGRMSPRAVRRSFRADELSSRSQSVSSASSPHGSIPSIPSPPPESQPQSPMGRHLSQNKSSSPPAISPRSVRGQSHMRYGPMVGRTVSEQGSNHGSSASSFSDISGQFLRLSSSYIC
jgi:hypothetical protein